jgi:hypothetical protein
VVLARPREVARSCAGNSARAMPRPRRRRPRVLRRVERRDVRVRAPRTRRLNFACRTEKIR